MSPAATGRSSPSTRTSSRPSRSIPVAWPTSSAPGAGKITRTSRPTVAQPPGTPSAGRCLRVPAGAAPPLVPVGQRPQQRPQQRIPVGGRRAGQRQRGRRQPGPLTGSSSARSVTLSPTPSTTAGARSAGRHALGQDPGALRPARPAGRSATSSAASTLGRRGHRLDQRDAGEQRQPPVPGGRHRRPPRPGTGSPGRSSTLNAMPARAGAGQPRPRRPRPALCHSATTTRPSGSPARAAAATSAFVEPVSGTHLQPGPQPFRRDQRPAQPRPHRQRRPVQIGVRRAVASGQPTASLSRPVRRTAHG